MALNYTWAELWEYYESIEDPKIKAQLREEVLGQGWLQSRAAKVQTKVLEGAPKELVDSIHKFLRPEVQIVLGYNPYL